MIEESARRSPGGGVAAALERPADRSAAVQTSRIEARSAVELRICARPDPALDSFEAQARSMYARLLAELAAQGAGPPDVVSEKVFLSDIAAQARGLREVRRACLPAGRNGASPGPAVTLVQQPPAGRGLLCEIQVFALLPAAGAEVRARRIDDTPPGVTVREVLLGGRRLAFLSGVTGGERRAGAGFEEQARSMFRQAERSLRRIGMTFRNVARTWIYVADIDRDYAALNRARREFFLSRNVLPPPASTGIGGVPETPGRDCALDLIAAAGDRERVMRPLHAPTMNEAPAYGSDFSRGMRLDLDDRAIIYISGTASIDAGGRVAHAEDIEAQAERMLLNVGRLLAGEGATLDETTSAVTYLKRPELLEPFCRAAARSGLSVRIPNTLCVADVCRPDWLCEIEATAVIF